MKNYLSTRELARAIGASESSLKRWADGGLIRGYRTAGGHRRFDLREAIRFIRESAMPVREPGLLGVPDLEGSMDLSHQPDETSQQFSLALENGESVKVRAMLVSMYLGGQDVAEICDGPVASAMHRLGEIWEHRSDGIMIEHRATDICISALNQLRSLLPAPEPDAPVALGGAPPDDPYLLASLMAATVMAAEGWHEVNLGPQSPLDVLVAAAKKDGARLVWLSLSVEQPAEQLVKNLRGLADRLLDHDVSVVVGGRALPQPLKLKRPNLHETRSMSELAAFARGLRSSHPGQGGPTVSPPDKA